MKILVAIPNEFRKMKERFVTDRVQKELETLGEVYYNPLNRPYTREEMRESLENVDILVTGWCTVNLDKFVLEKANKLKVVAYTAGSVIPIISEELYNKGVIVLSGNPVFAESVAEGTICYIMCSLRNLKYFIIRGESWKVGDEDSEKGIMDRAIGLIGFGMISKYVIRMLKPFRVKMKVFSNYLTDEEAVKYGVTKASLDEIFETCDIISVHSGLNEKNYHLINARLLKKMQDGALIVNTARGAVIDEQALIDELKTGRINAALDVYEEEPLPKNSPLRDMDNALLLPHLGGPTIDRQEYVTLALIKDLRKWINGEKELECQISHEYAKNMTNEGLKWDKK